jgi:hypothetical protein
MRLCYFDIVWILCFKKRHWERENRKIQLHKLSLQTYLILEFPSYSNETWMRKENGKSLDAKGKDQENDVRVFVISIYF